MSKDEGLSFWDHLDVLRTIIIRIILATVVCGIVAFLFKEELFAVVCSVRRLILVISCFFLCRRLFMPTRCGLPCP